MSYAKRFRVSPGESVRLSAIDADFTDRHESKRDARKQMERDDRRLAELQRLLYAEHRGSVLICLQGLDAAGKDGTIRHVFAALNPQGARVAASRRPRRKRPITTSCGELTPLRRAKARS